MPCRVDICPRCNEYDCGGFAGACRYPNGKPKDTVVVSKSAPKDSFDTSGALCDVLSLLEDKFPDVLVAVDPKTRNWWKKHTKLEKDKIKKEALAKLTPRERKALGLK